MRFILLATKLDNYTTGDVGHLISLVLWSIRRQLLTFFVNFEFSEMVVLALYSCRLFK